jgi:DNA (cytosine-5)-methyltransferase 1
LVVSLFCGAGGETCGKELAFKQLGIDPFGVVSHAVNHWDNALSTHKRNFPWIQTHQEDICAVTADDFGMKGKVIDLLWASPSCVHHSRARGGRPREEQQRAHADEVVERFLRRAKVNVYLMENVSEFCDWGPLYQTHSCGCRAGIYNRFLSLSGVFAGRDVPVKCTSKHCHFNQPIKERKGEYFQRFLSKLYALGYKVEYRILCAADYGDATTRRRLFLQAVLDGHPIVWPMHLFQDKKKALTPASEHLPHWKMTADCIDWSIPCRSIFGRKKPLAEATQRRIAAGVVRYMLQGEPFVVPAVANQESDAVAAHVVNLRGTAADQIRSSASSLEDPLHTISAGGNHAALCAAFLSKYAGVGKGASRITTAALVQMGYGERAGQAPRILDIEAPLGTVVAGGCKHGLLTANLVGIGDVEGEGPAEVEPRRAVVAALMTNTTGHAPTSMEQPMPALTTGNHQYLIAGFLTHYYKSGGQMQGLDLPLHTITTKARHSLVLVKIKGEDYVITDIAVRMLKSHELAKTMGFPDDFQWVNPDGKPLSEADRIKMVGNACPVNTVAALIKAVILERPEAFGLPESLTA